MHDLHCMVSGVMNTCQIYNAQGVLLRTLPAFPHGINGPSWKSWGGDTVPGLYRVTSYVPTEDPDLHGKIGASYGKGYFYLQEMEGQEQRYNRAGEGWHGGGTGLADPLADFQELLATEGCVRSHNKDIQVLATVFHQVWALGGTVWFTVIQAES